MTSQRDFNLHAANALRMVRLQRRLTQKQMGELFDLSQTAYGSYETGEARVTAGMIGVVAKKMNVPTSIFFPSDQNGGAT